ncbi:AGE family epimerase/isomerase, partial [Staphylococcus aureus]|uniref:AGE family epimerase/isomerase n=1 Tax=Staphylococcus aureus TaxID=1280 RepID=UPI0039BE772B
LDRALMLADHMTRRQAALADGLVWEHYDTQWRIDWDYNRDNPKHLFRPWGFQPGHQTEWAKLLMILEPLLLERNREERWIVPTARHLFDTAV